ncbi:MAG: hypothetical protein PHO10_00525 [Gemmiger sp.]|nr:hypothetical protein [Gemmiger sp.]
MHYIGLDCFLNAPVWPLAYWQHFSAPALDAVLAGYKQQAPQANALRLWLSYGAWQRNPAAALAALEQALGCAARHGLAVMPCLFARRGAGRYGDAGELTLDRILPGIGWAYQRGFYLPYFRQLAEHFAADPRILGWDICTGAWPGGGPAQTPHYAAEYALLRELYFALHGCGVQTPVGITRLAATPLPDDAAACFDFVLQATPGTAGQALAGQGLDAVFTAEEEFSVQEISCG